MSKKEKISGSWANALTYMGRLYRNPADAVKEYTSNALDKWQEGSKGAPCIVDYFLHRDKITISYDQPGMDEREFRAALHRVTESVKAEMRVPQIGQLGIGIFAFNQVGEKCTFFSKKTKNSPTTKVMLRSNSDEAEFDTAPKRESLDSPGMRIEIEQLLQDPTKPRGPLGIERLAAFFGDKFDAYLRADSLRLTLHSNGKTYSIRPREVKSQRIGLAFEQVRLPRDPAKVLSCTFWFDAAGKSAVSIRHAQVPIIEDLKTIQAYGLEESVFASGYVKGYIDADFLKPQPARTSFVEDRDWIDFLDALDKVRPSLEHEVEALRREGERQRLSQLQRKALDMARDILASEDFQDLALLGGLRIPRGSRDIAGPTTPKKRPEPPNKLPTGGTKPRGPRINLEERPFEDESPPHKLHSRFLAGLVQVNTLNPDFQREVHGADADILAYDTMMIGKETIAYNDTSGVTNEYLERMLSFLFEVKRRIGGQAVTLQKKRGRPRKLAA